MPFPLREDGTLTLVIDEMRTCAARQHGHDGFCYGSLLSGEGVYCESFDAALSRCLGRQFSAPVRTAISRTEDGWDWWPDEPEWVDDATVRARRRWDTEKVNGMRS